MKHYSKGQLILKANILVLIWTKKTNEIIFLNAALASKMSQIKKMKALNILLGGI